MIGRSRASQLVVAAKIDELVSVFPVLEIFVYLGKAAVGLSKVSVVVRMVVFVVRFGEGHSRWESSWP